MLGGAVSCPGLGRCRFRSRSRRACTGCLRRYELLRGGGECPDEDDGTPWRILVRRDIKNLNAVEILKEIVSDSLILGRWLLLAIVLEALIVRYVPSDVVSSILGTDGIFSVLLAGLISVPLYLNGVGAIPVVEGLMNQGMAAGAGVTFLLGGAITTIPAMVAVRSVVKGNVFAFYLGVGLVGSVGIGLAALPLL